MNESVHSGHQFFVMCYRTAAHTMLKLAAARRRRTGNDKRNIGGSAESLLTGRLRTDGLDGDEKRNRFGTAFFVFQEMASWCEA